MRHGRMTGAAIAVLACLLVVAAPAPAQVYTFLNAVTANGSGPAFDTGAASGIRGQVCSAAGSTATVTWEQSVTGSAWTAVSGGVATNPSAACQLFSLPGAPYTRATVSGYSAGTITATGEVLRGKPLTMVGATSVADGRGGLVPSPAAGDDTKFLRGDGTYAAAGGGISGLSTGKITKATSSTAIGDSVLSETSSVVSHQMGSGTGSARLVGVANANTTAVTNSGTSEQDLMTYTLPANSFNANGRAVRVTATVTTTGANNKTIKFYFGAASTWTPILTDPSATTWFISLVVIRTGASAQYWAGTSTKTSSFNASSSGTLSVTDTADITVKFTATEATAGGGISQKLMLVEFLN